jgi:asparagine synthase (glutamine-hydrolysing)
VCGICGRLNFDTDDSVSQRSIKAMADSISHRGPDDEGFYISGSIGLGFRRLSIIDLSGGHQPLANEDETVWIVFNGEIYNFQELRDWLETRGHSFRTRSDTEVIVHLYEELGPACVEKLRGMFAFAIWDLRQRSLFLARDRIGIKPLYYFLSENCLIFASEVKAILVNPEVERRVVPSLIDKVLTFNFLPGEETLLKNIHKLAPGSWMLIRDGRTRIHQYWDLKFDESGLSLPQAESRLTELLEESVRLHMISDVPVGFLLSGGVDSTAMLGLAHGKTDQSLSSFTVGFKAEGVVDERPYARLAAARYGTNHHELTISSKEFEGFLSRYTWHLEEPICEPPAVALYYISKLARESVKVLISGEGGDEAFAGYQIYRNLLWLERLKTVLGPLKGTVSRFALQANSVFRSRQISRYGRLLALPFESSYYSGTSSPLSFFNQFPERLYTADFYPMVCKQKSIEMVERYLRAENAHGVVNKLLYADTKTWLPNDLLLKADKMTMANSVELRVPFLDHRLLEFAASLPGNYKVRGLTTKYIAKKVLSDKVPREILQRKKVGFPVPYSSWLRGDLKDWLQDLLLDSRTLNRGYFKKDCIEYLLAENLQTGAYSKEVFTLAVMELWHREFLGAQGPVGESASAVLNDATGTVVGD